MRILQGLAVAAATLVIATLSTPRADARRLQPATPETLQRVAARLGSTVLAYWVTDGATAVTAVDRDGRVTSQSIPVTRARLQQLVELTWPVAATPGSAASRQEADSYLALYELLIAPVRASLPGRDSLITVVPDGPLGNLSFAPLANANGRALIEDYRLHYLPVVSDVPPAPDSANRRDTFLFVANSASASREVRAIIRALRLNNPTMLIGKDATERAVRAAIGKARVAHLAMPGLSASLIAGLHLSADLVVLSTHGAQNMAPEDGPLVLPRAFMTAGARTILMPLWETEEEAWQPLITGFYLEWQEGGDKSSALRASQLAVLRDLRAGRLRVNTSAGDKVLPAQPRLWANAILIGEP